jgi:hypothetical protein
MIKQVTEVVLIFYHFSIKSYILKKFVGRK